MSALVCPGCKAPIDASWRVCQSCKHPLATFVQEALESEKRGAPSQIPGAVMFAGAALLVVGLAAFGVRTWKAAMQAPLPAPAPTLPSASQALAEPPPPSPKPEPPPPKESLWKFEGSVYRLSDAKAAAGVEVRLERASNGQKWSSVTDAAGRYSISVPVVLSATTESYNFSLRRGGKQIAFIEDEPSLPFRGRTRAQREEIVEQTRRSSVLHTPVSPDSTLTTQDFALLP